MLPTLLTWSRAGRLIASRWRGAALVQVVEPRSVWRLPAQLSSMANGHLHYKIQCVQYSSEMKREDVPPSRYPIPQKTSLDEDIQEEMAKVEEKTGFLPNVLKAMSHRPDEFRAFFRYYDVLMSKESGSLTKAEREMIVVVTSAANNCLYCVVAHSALHRIFSKNPYVADQVATTVEMANLSPRERAIVNFALKICKMEPVTEDDFVDLENHNLDREDAWDIGAIAAFFALSNRMAHLSEMRPNEEFYLLGRVPRDKGAKDGKKQS